MTVFPFSFSFQLGPVLQMIKTQMQVSCRPLLGKLYYRRGTANASDRIKKIDEAIEDFKMAKELNPSTASQCEKTIKELIARKNIVAKQEAKRVRRALCSG